jgi:hypothetical protein
MPGIVSSVSQNHQPVVDSNYYQKRHPDDNQQEKQSD